MFAARAHPVCGNVQTLRTVPRPLVALRYMDTLDKMAQNNNVVWMPHSATDLASMIGGYKKLIETASVTTEQPAAAGGAG